MERCWGEDQNCHADAQEVSASTLPVAAAASLWEHLHVPVPTQPARQAVLQVIFVFCSASHGMGWNWELQVPGSTRTL